MKSTEFLTEEEVKPYISKRVTKSKALDFLQQHCSQALAALKTPGSTQLYRGMRSLSNNIVYINPASGERASQNTSNYYTQLIDNNPEFANWPKRSKSLICTTDAGKAMGYSTEWGDYYVILPFDNAKIAVCPKRDMWDTPVDLLGIGLNIDGRHLMLNSLNNKLKYGFNAPENYSEMLAYFNSPDVEPHFKKVKKDVPAGFKKLVKTPQDVIPYIQSQLSPAKTGFKLLPYPKFINSKLPNNECWLDSEVVAVHISKIDNIINTI